MAGNGIEIGAQAQAQARALALIERRTVEFRARLTRHMVALGLLRGHIAADGRVCVGHFALQHDRAADADEGQADELGDEAADRYTDTYELGGGPAADESGGGR